MNQKEMEALYDKLCAYTPKTKVRKKDGIPTFSSFMDCCCGTCVDYSFGEYSIECHFSYYSYPEGWVIFVTPLLHSDVRFQLSEPVRFGGDCPELFEEIDRIAQALETMPSIMDFVKRSYEARIKDLR